MISQLTIIQNQVMDNFVGLVFDGDQIVLKYFCMGAVDLLLLHCEGVIAKSDEGGNRYLKVVPTIIIIFPRHLCLDSFLIIVNCVFDLPEKSVFINLIGQKLVNIIYIRSLPFNFHDVASAFQKFLHFHFKIILVEIFV